MAKKATGVNTMNIAFDQPGAGTAGFGVNSRNIAKKMAKLYEHRNDEDGGSKQIWEKMVQNTDKSLARSPKSAVSKAFKSYLTTGKLPKEISPHFLKYSMESLDVGLRETGRSAQHKSNFLDSTFGQILHAIGTIALGFVPVVGPYLAAAAGGINAASRTRPSGLSIAGGVVGGYAGGSTGANLASGISAAGGVGPYLSNAADAAGNFIQHPINSIAGAASNFLDPPLTSVTYTPGAGAAGFGPGMAVSGATGVAGPVLSGAAGRGAAAAGGAASTAGQIATAGGKVAKVVNAGLGIAAAAGLTAAVGGSKVRENSSKAGSQTTRTAPRSAEAKKVLKDILEVSAAQVAGIKKLGTFTDAQFAQLLPILANEVNKFLPKENQLTAKSLGVAEAQIGSQAELNQRALDQVRNGVSLTPEQSALITASANDAIKSGLSDISAYRDQSLRSLAQETAIGRGLRPEDTPILDVGGRVINESSRQASNLITGIRGQESAQKLQYPIDAGNYIAGITQAQQTQGSNATNLVQQLRQQAFNNRLNLTSTVGNLGVNRAQIGPSANTLPTLSAEGIANSTTDFTGTASGSTRTSDPLGDFSRIAGGVGAVASTIDDLHLFGP